MSTAQNPSLPPRDDDLPLGAMIGGFDWSTTPLGPIEAWPDRLRFAAEICHRMPAAAAVYWGPELTILYNESFATLLGPRHPAKMGRPAREVWGHLWDRIGPQFAQVLATGTGLSVAEWMVPILRDGQAEESYWTYSLAPLVDAVGNVAGILTQREDVTRPVQAQRRLAFQVELADALRGVNDPEDVKQAAAGVLGPYLGAARVGFAEVDEANGTLTVRTDWTRGPEAPTLAGHEGPLSDLGAEALAFLRSGEVMVVPDLLTFLPPQDPLRAQWEALGVRALITVALVREGRMKALLYVHEPQPREWRRSEAAMVRDVAERSWAAVERAQAEQSLRESEDHYRHAVELNPQVTWTALPDGVINRASSRWEEWTGTSGLAGAWRGGMHPDDWDKTLAGWARSLTTGEAYDEEHRVIRRDGSYRWARSRAFPRRDAEGKIVLWYGTTEDIHEQKVAEERQRLLINELNHRVKNTLATVQAIAAQTLRGDIPLAEARAQFEARLMALARAHNILTEENWAGAELGRVAADATEHLGGARRVQTAGEPLRLRPRAALALSLALHELGTNAVKYGALSIEDGHVSLNWRRTDAGRFVLEWKELGGPGVSPPQRRGFGSRLIEQGLGPDLGGKARLDFEPDGLRCTIEAPLDAMEGESTIG